MEEVHLSYRSVDGVVNSVYFSANGNTKLVASGPQLGQAAPINHFYQVLEAAAKSNGGVKVLGGVDDGRRRVLYDSSKPHVKAKSFQELLDRLIS